MNNLIKEESQNKELFKELFFSMQKKLNCRFERLKNNCICSNCNVCCELRYAEFSLLEIRILAQENENWRDFLEFFEEVDFSSEKIPEKWINYIKKVRENSDFEPVFYKCKFFYNGKCNYKGIKKSFCKKDGISFDKVLHSSCSFVKMQKMILDDIEKKIFKDLFIKQIQIKNLKKDFCCNCCAICCKLASSEFSYKKLKEKSKKGDNFSSQFIDIFVPYKNFKDARKVYPEYFDFLKKKLNKDEKIYFYHCKHLNSDGLCSQYEKRPDICKDFPDNPLGLLPECCGYKPWKEEMEVLALSLRALEILSKFYYKKIRAFLWD